MKKTLIILALFFSVSLNAQNKKEVCTEVDEHAEFKGGQQELFKYIATQVNYPATAKADKLGGKVFVKFIVNKDGSIEDAAVVKGAEACPECDAEALRVVSSMPKWTPAKLKGKEVNSYYTIPIKFNPT